MDSKTMQRMHKHITENEKSVPHPYKDNKGLLTVGTGFKVNDEKSFVAMKFQIKDAKTGQWRNAEDDEKRAEFLRAKGLSNTELLSDAGTRSEMMDLTHSAQGDYRAWRPSPRRRPNSWHQNKIRTISARSVGVNFAAIRLANEI